MYVIVATTQPGLVIYYVLILRLLSVMMIAGGGWARVDWGWWALALVARFVGAGNLLRLGGTIVSGNSWLVDIDRKSHCTLIACLTSVDARKRK